MPDREKVVMHLNDCMEASRRDNTWVFVRKDTIVDALALLKEQEAVKPKSKVRHGASAQIQHFCGNCNTMLHGKPKFCSECGRSVKWE